MTAATALAAASACLLVQDAPARPDRIAATSAPTVAVHLTDSALTLSRSEVPAGPVRFVVVNRGARPHDFRIAGRTTRILAAGQRAELLVRFSRTGSFPCLSTVAGDTRRGLRGSLTVRELGVKLTQIGTFNGPDFLTAPPRDRHRLFVVEKPGTIHVVVDGRVLPRPFLDLSTEVLWNGNEQGLLSMAFAPDYAKSGRFYVYFTDLEENARLLELRRSTTDPNVADPATRRELLHVIQPSGEHYGGMLLFGPDGYLYLSLGDGGEVREREPLRAQIPSELHGKILRIDPRPGHGMPYTIPRSNPFVDDPAFRPEIWVRGFRNPWRFWIDPQTEDLFVGDVGEFIRESIKYAPAASAAGTNFGWPCFEGGLPSTVYGPELCPGAVPPLYEYARESGFCAVIGGLVVRDPRLPGLSGRYVFSDFCKGEIRSLELAGKGVVERSLGIIRPGTTSFGQDALGRVYVTSLYGPVWRLDPRVRRPPAEGPTAPGRPANGKELFISTGCGVCHTLAAAATLGAIGPNLDEEKPPRDEIVDRITNGTKDMPSFRGQFTNQQIEDFVAFILDATGP